MTSHTENEELAQIKDWWKRSGRPLLSGGVLALTLVLAWQGWQKYQSGQAYGASALYQQLLDASLRPSGKPDTARIAELYGQLQSNFGGTHYAQYGSLLVTKVAVEEGRLDEAAAALRGILDKPADATLGEVARQRLARVLAAQDKAEEGLALLAGEADPAFQAAREEVRGDLLVRLGRLDEARAAYEKARSAQPADAGPGPLQLKLDELAKGDA
ncbi:YfgM family protein [Azorhizophilus paspali]|uniref:Ancillary SecYEG translocon subunit n=1 Tax=Azorhizophilus paspali TaxID=69963 RepID=A0ABV6SG45_AZOPA